MRRGALAVAGVLAAAGVLSGCRSTPAPTAHKAPRAAWPTEAATSSSTATAAEPSCPPEAGSPQALPQQASGFPLPPGTTLLKSSEVAGGNDVVAVRLRVPLSFHASVKFFLEKLPEHGFVLGTGDSEAEEADIPATRGDEHLTLKVRALPDPCQSEAVLTSAGEDEDAE